MAVVKGKSKERNTFTFNVLLASNALLLLYMVLQSNMNNDMKQLHSASLSNVLESTANEETIQSDNGSAVTKAATSISTKATEIQASIKRKLSFTFDSHFIPLVGDQNFYDLGKKTGTDKVIAQSYDNECSTEEGRQKNPGLCTAIPCPECTKPECRPRGHRYNTLYQRWLGHLSRKDTPPFQFLEIGFYHGNGFSAFTDFFHNGEGHSMEISCIEHGPREEGKWPWDNFASKSPKYQQMRDANRLHCGDASDLQFLNGVYKTHMKRPDSPPLMLVIDDGAHISDQMVQTFFYWFPRIEPGGFLVIEDIQPFGEMKKFREEFLPQIISDLDYCGNPKYQTEDKAPFFPTLYPLIKSFSCEMHICIFERNNQPAMELSIELSKYPEHALDLQKAKQLVQQDATVDKSNPEINKLVTLPFILSY